MDGFAIGILIIHELMNSTKMASVKPSFFETSSSAVNRELTKLTPQYLIFTLIFGAIASAGIHLSPAGSWAPPRSFEAYPTHWPFGWPNVHVRIPLLQ